MTRAQLDEILFLQELHQGWVDADTPIGVLHSRWLLKRLGEFEGALRHYCGQTTIGSPYGAQGLKGAVAHHELYREYFERVLTAPASNAPALTLNAQITEQYRAIESLEQTLSQAKQQLQGLLRANSLVRELGGEPSLVDDSAG
jgi:hypothetical protein